ncbi:MAG: tetratricopeptide repeat protein [Bacteroidia bacterium]
MKKYILSVLLLFSGISYIHACINELGEKPADWTVIKRDFGPLMQIDSIPQDQLFNYLHMLEAIEDTSSAFVRMNDMAVVYMQLQDPATARDLLIEVERKFPGHYSVAANLGTAYELLGKLDSALFWIKKAVSIDPNAHNGSEWIHVMILSYRIAKEKNPQYLSGSSALMLDFGTMDLPSNPYGLNIEKVRDELGYQLRERLSFIRPPDTLMGMLLFDFANLVALSDQAPQSLWYYEAARDFGFTSELLDARVERIEEILAKEPDAKLSKYAGEEVDAEGEGIQVYVLAGIIAILAVAGVWLLLRKGRNNR